MGYNVPVSTSETIHYGSNPAGILAERISGIVGKKGKENHRIDGAVVTLYATKHLISRSKVGIIERDITPLVQPDGIELLPYQGVEFSSLRKGPKTRTVSGAKIKIEDKLVEWKAGAKAPKRERRRLSRKTHAESGELLSPELNFERYTFLLEGISPETRMDTYGRIPKEQEKDREIARKFAEVATRALFQEEVIESPKPVFLHHTYLRREVTRSLPDGGMYVIRDTMQKDGSPQIIVHVAPKDPSEEVMDYTVLQGERLGGKSSGERQYRPVSQDQAEAVIARFGTPPRHS